MSKTNSDPLAIPPYEVIVVGKGGFQVWDSLNHTVSEHTTKEEAIRAVKIASEKTSTTTTMCISLLRSILKEEMVKPPVDLDDKIKMTEIVTWCDKMDKRAYHLPSGCTRMGMREGKITKAFGVDSSTDTFYEFVVDSSCSSHEVIRLKWGQFSYTLVEEWLRNNMIKEAIRTLDRRTEMDNGTR